MTSVLVCELLPDATAIELAVLDHGLLALLSLSALMNEYDHNSDKHEYTCLQYVSLYTYSQ